MKRKWLVIGISTVSVILLILISLSNVVGYQAVQTSQQNLIKERINQRELLFQTIVDFTNNMEIQRIILISQISRGVFPPSEIPVITKNQIRQMYFLGLILSKVISKSRILSIIETYKLNNQNVQKKITAIIERDNKLSEEITQLSNLNCQCENQSTKNQVQFPLICSILLILLCVPAFFILIIAVIGFPLVVIDIYVDNPIVTFLMAICAIPIIIWSPVFIAISSVMFLLECFGPWYPPL